MQYEGSPPRRRVRRRRPSRIVKWSQFLMEEGEMSLVTVSLFTTWMTLLLMDVRLMGLVHVLLLAALWMLFRRGDRKKVLAETPSR